MRKLSVEKLMSKGFKRVSFLKICLLKKWYFCQELATFKKSRFGSSAVKPIMKTPVLLLFKTKMLEIFVLSLPYVYL